MRRACSCVTNVSFAGANVPHVTRRKVRAWCVRTGRRRFVWHAGTFLLLTRILALKSLANSARTFWCMPAPRFACAAAPRFLTRAFFSWSARTGPWEGCAIMKRCVNPCQKKHNLPPCIPGPTPSHNDVATLSQRRSLCTVLHILVGASRNGTRANAVFVI